jgi:hypothetical protein
MFSRPDSQSFPRFLISLGFLVLLAGFVAPGLILKDTGTLRITQAEIRRLTPVAQGAIEHRQRVDRDAGEYSVWAIPAGIVGGGLLMAFGGAGLYRREGVEERKRSAEVEELEQKIRPQTPEEREEGIRAEAAGLGDETGDFGGRPSGPSEPIFSPTPSDVGAPRPPTRGIGPHGAATGDFERDPATSAEALVRALGVEDAVVTRLQSIAEPRYKVHSHIVVGKRRFDALLISQPFNEAPDILVEIKYRHRLAQRALTDFAARVSAARGVVGPHAIGWFIQVLDREPGAEHDADELDVDASDAVVNVTVIGLQGIFSLGLPV